MTAAKIKICGLRRPVDINYVNEAKPDFAGFILTPGFRRSVDEAQAAQLAECLDSQIQRVGVFVNDDIDHIVDIVRAGTVDMVQLHGAEDEAYMDRLRAKLEEESCPVPLVKAFTVRGPDDIEAARANSADYVLLDNGKGTGQAFDWRLIADIGRPFFLAGGLDPDNISQAIQQFHPFAVDISSGVETDGYKDELKVRAAVAAARKESK